MISTNIRDVKMLAALIASDQNAYEVSEQLSKVGISLISDESKSGGDLNYYLIAHIKPEQLSRKGEKIIIKMSGMFDGAEELAQEFPVE